MSDNDILDVCSRIAYVHSLYDPIHHRTDSLWQSRLSKTGSLQHILGYKTDDAKSLESKNLTARTNQELGLHEIGSHGGESTFAQNHPSQGFLGGLGPPIEMGRISPYQEYSYWRRLLRVHMRLQILTLGISSLGR